MTDLQAALDQIKERMKVGGYRTVALGGDPEAKVWPAETWKVCDSQADVPRLVASLEAVLEYCAQADQKNREERGLTWFDKGAINAAADVEEILSAVLTGEDDG